MNFYKITCAFFILTFIISCTKEDELTFQNHSNKVDRQVSSLQAKSFANSISNKLFVYKDGAGLKSATAGEERNISDLQAILSSDKDTVMYSLNFGNNLGFMIIAADKGSFPLVAFVDSGSFCSDESLLNPTVAAWLEEKKTAIAQNMQTELDSSSNNFKLWNSIADDSCDIELDLVSSIPENQLKSTGTRRFSTNRSTIYPMIGANYSWGQGLGYNYNAKVKGALAGCPAVAIGFLCMHHWFPSNYGYMYMPKELPSNYNQQNAISLMFRAIGDSIPFYSWDIRGSGAAPSNYLTGLQRLGYKDAKLVSFDFETAYNNLKNGNPLLLRGNSPSTSGGHVWFCDGYSEMAWKITKYKRNWLGQKKKVDEWYEYADYLYMNWGWCGDSNGWYEQADWSTGGFVSNRQMFIDLYPVYSYSYPYYNTLKN